MTKKMSVVLAAICVLGMAATGAYAQTVTSFRWTSDANNFQDSEGVNIPSGATILTYLTPDQTINFDPLDFLQESYGNDFFYRAMGSGLGGRYTTSFMTEEQPDDFAVGLYAYFIALDMPLTDFEALAEIGDVPVGTYYAVSGISPQIIDLDTPQPGTAQTFNMGYIQTTAMIIPEPGTILMFALGVVMLGVRRFIRYRKQ